MFLFVNVSHEEINDVQEVSDGDPEPVTVPAG